MLFEKLTFLATFITTTGLAVIGTLVSHQLFSERKKPEFQTLLYQQIFLFSFLIYAIWGNLAFRQIISDLTINTELFGKLVLFIPLPGIPFLLVSWFMLLKFGFNANGYVIPVKWIFIYFAGFTIFLTGATFLYQNNYFEAPAQPDLFLIRLFVSVNLFVHLLFVIPFLVHGNRSVMVFKEFELRKCMYIYVSGVIIYSAMLWYYGVFGYLSAAGSILFLFSTGALLPVCLKYTCRPEEEVTPSVNNNFETFCTEFKISKREAEIIREICTGKTNKAIAEKLFITLQTVKDHSHRIYTKTQVKSRVQLANLVREKTGEVKQD
jgi:DNA-binding CsgD family transcriptional regulator